MPHLSKFLIFIETNLLQGSIGVSLEWWLQVACHTKHHYLAFREPGKLVAVELFFFPHVALV